MEEKKKTTAIKSTEAAKEAYKFPKLMYARAIEGKERGIPVVWCKGSGGFTLEIILDAMDVLPVYPENFGATCAAKRANLPYLEACESDGYAHVLCGYARTGIGFSRRMAEAGGEGPPDAPVGGMAKPTVIIGNSAYCDAAFKWWQAMARYLDVPCYCTDIFGPPVGRDIDEEVRDYYIKYLAEEQRNLVAALAKHGIKLDMDRLCETVATHEKTKRLWWECHELRKAIPCPMPSGDMWACVAPLYWMSGQKIALEYCQRMYDELKYRVENKIGVIENERYRLMWTGLPPWHTLELINYMESQGAVSVIETWEYYPPPPPQIPESVTDPFERLAWGLFNFWTYIHPQARGEAEQLRAQEYIRWAREWKCDGNLAHMLVSCRSATIGQVHSRNALLRHAKIPSILIEGDIVDARAWSEAETKMRADAFIETMEHYKRIREQEGLA